VLPDHDGHLTAAGAEIEDALDPLTPQQLHGQSGRDAERGFSGIVPW
jgi:hypothetical protein